MDDIKLPIILRKPKGRTYIHIDVDKDMGDDWFIKISYRKNKTGEETKQSTIIRKDLEGWLKSLLKEYNIEKNNSTDGN